MIILTNIGEGSRHFVLAHESYCTVRGRCACSRRFANGPLQPTVLALAPGERRVELGNHVLSVPAVERAIAQGNLRVEADHVG